MSYTLIAIFLVLSLLGVPLAVSLGIGVAATLLIYDMDLMLLPQSMYTSMNSFLLVAVPLFILAGNIMAGGGISDRIFVGAESLVGRFRGGLGQVNIIGSAVFGGISGSSVADVASIGAIEIRAMTQHKYPRDYAAAMTMVTSTLSSVIPPSILMIIAAAAAGESVGAALAGGIGPSVLFIFSLMVLNYVMSVRKGYGEVSRTSMKQAAKNVAVGIPALGGPVVILGGIFGGFFTPTEAACVAVLYSLVVGVFLYRDMKPRSIPNMIIRSGATTGTVLFIAMVASAASYIFTIDGLPIRVSDALLSISDNPTVVLLLVGLGLVLIGTVMDIIAAILILVPVLMPTVQAVGIDPIHFVVFLVACLAMGLVTPPVGVCLFAASYVSGLSIERIAKAARPHYAIMVVALILLAVVPQFTLWPVELLTDYQSV
jgi:tripartite ATP-independent transporter DctM subunit